MPSNKTHCNLSTLEEEAGESCVKVQPKLQYELKARVGYKEVPCHTDGRKEKERVERGMGERRAISLSTTL